MSTRLLILALVISVFPEILAVENVFHASIDQTEIPAGELALGTKLNSSPDFNECLWNVNNQRNWRTIKDLELEGTSTRQFKDLASNLEDFALRISPVPQAVPGSEASKPVKKGAGGKSDGPNQPFSLSLRKAVHSAIRVLEFRSGEDTERTFQQLQELIVQFRPAWSDALRVIKNPERIRIFMEHLIDSIAGDQLQRNFFAFETNLRQQFPEQYPPIREGGLQKISLQGLFESGAIKFHGKAYQAYMNFVERAENLLKVGIEDLENPDNAATWGERRARKPGMSKEETAKKKNQDSILSPDQRKLRDQLTFNVLDLNELDKSKYPENPFEGLQEKEIEHLRTAIRNEKYFASESKIQLWLRIHEIRQETTERPPRPPQRIAKESQVISEFYENAKEEGKNIAILNRITRMLSVVLEEPDMQFNNRKTLAFIYIIEQMLLHRYARMSKVEEQFQNLIFFFSLAHSFSEILLDYWNRLYGWNLLGEKGEPVRRFTYSYYWNLVKKGNWKTSHGGGGFMDMASRLNFQLGESYGLYLGCAYNFQKIAKRNLKGSHEQDVVNSLDLHSLLANGIHPPEKKRRLEDPEPIFDNYVERLDMRRKTFLIRPELETNSQKMRMRGARPYVKLPARPIRNPDAPSSAARFSTPSTLREILSGRVPEGHEGLKSRKNPTHHSQEEIIPVPPIQKPREISKSRISAKGRKHQNWPVGQDRVLRKIRPHPWPNHPFLSPDSSAFKPSGWALNPVMLPKPHRVDQTAEIRQDSHMPHASDQFTPATTSHFNTKMVYELYRGAFQTQLSSARPGVNLMTPQPSGTLDPIGSAGFSEPPLEQPHPTYPVNFQDCISNSDSCKRKAISISNSPRTYDQYEMSPYKRLGIDIASSIQHENPQHLNYIPLKEITMDRPNKVIDVENKQKKPKEIKIFGKILGAPSTTSLPESTKK